MNSAFIAMAPARCSVHRFDRGAIETEAHGAVRSERGAV
jgi:hypothetical protein